jgi:aryl sulfotransferase
MEQKSFIQSQPIHELAKMWDLSYKEQADIDVLDIEPHKCFYRISSIFRMPIEDIDNYLDRCTHVWTHSPFCERSFVVLPKFDKVVYIIRDPRDRAISASRFRFTPYMKKYYPHGEPDPDTWLAHRLESTMRHWVQHVGGYLKHKDDLEIHVVFYERLLRSFDTELSELLDYLGIELDDEAISHIKHEVDFTTMKSKNPQHVRKGKSGRWMEVFTEAQKKQAARIAGPMLQLLNYPFGEDQMDSSLPCVPVQLSTSQVEKAIAHANRRVFLEKVKRGVKHAYALMAK